MARLILINGAPGSGKSTLARRYAGDHPLAVALDIDVVRGMLGRWLDQPVEAGLLARRMAVAMARVPLAEDRDVVVPQYLGRPEFVTELDALAREAGAEFVEIALVSGPAEALARFVRRSGQPESGEHRAATALQERSGGTAALPQMYQRMLDVIAGRPRTRTVVTVDGQAGQTYQRLLAHLQQAPDPAVR